MSMEPNGYYDAVGAQGTAAGSSHGYADAGVGAAAGAADQDEVGYGWYDQQGYDAGWDRHDSSVAQTDGAWAQTGWADQGAGAGSYVYVDGAAAGALADDQSWSNTWWSKH